MQELIKIEERNGKSIVNARNLHDYLVKDANGGQTGEMFAHWIQRMIDYGFEKDIDYTILEYDYKGDVIFSKSEKQHVSKRDFALTIECAKEISMLQRNDKGKEARKYFIKCENRLKQIKKTELPQDYLSALKALVASEEQKQLAQSKVKELHPKAESYDQFISSYSLQGFKEVANILGYGRNTMMKELRSLKIITSRNIPYQKYLEAGYFEVKESTQNGFNIATTYVTPKGIEYLKKKLK